VADAWNADRLAAVLSCAAHESYANHYRVTLVSTGNGTSETYDVEERVDWDGREVPLVLVRAADGARFEVEFWANVTQLGSKEVADVQQT
jgi:hypothetical protein